MDANAVVQIALQRDGFGAAEREIARFGALSASAFRYDTGVAALRLSNPRGSVVVLPYLGQMVWAATFDGVDLAMKSLFPQPRPARTIVETYGCLAFHSGLLRNGVPSAEDDHAPHGEAPCAEMDRAGIECGADADGPWIAVTGERDYAMGFGARYRATPRVVLRANAAQVQIVMQVENRAAAPMDLMYLCHVNFAYADGARIVQPVPFTPEHVVARTAIPGHVVATPAYQARIAALAADPARTRVLDDSSLYDPEQVFYLRGLARGVDGLARFLLIRPEGDAFAIAWDPHTMPIGVRWLFDNTDQRVAAFAMPATCEPEGYTAERRKGNVRSLASGQSVTFVTNVGYLARDEVPAP